MLGNELAVRLPTSCKVQYVHGLEYQTIRHVSSGICIVFLLGLQEFCVGESKSTPSFEASSGSQFFNFGMVESPNTTTISVPFEIHNLTTRALAITKVITSCGCTTTVIGSRAKLPIVLRPHASLPVKVIIDSFT
jgi:hypothetical protein